MKLSPEWRRAWRRFSFQSLGWSLAGLAAWPNLPDNFREYIGPERAVWALGILLVLGMVGSVIDQPKTRTPKDD